MKYVLWLFRVLAAVPGVPGVERPSVVFRDSERIVLVRNEFFDKEQDRCYVETADHAVFRQRPGVSQSGIRGRHGVGGRPGAVCRLGELRAGRTGVRAAAQAGAGRRGRR